MYIWLFHRISGLILIFLFGIKIASGLFLYTREVKPEWALLSHRQPVVDVLILILFTFHSLYGIRTVVIDMGLTKEKAVSRAAGFLGIVISSVLVIFYLQKIW